MITLRSFTIDRRGVSSAGEVEDNLSEAPLSELGFKVVLRALEFIGLAAGAKERRRPRRPKPWRREKYLGKGCGLRMVGSARLGRGATRPSPLLASQ